MILMGTVLLPPLTGIVGQRFGFTPKLWMKGLVIFALFIIFGMVARPVDKPAEKDNPTAQTKETRVTTVTSDTASDTSTKNIESQSIDTTAKTETVSTQQKQKNPGQTGGQVHCLLNKSMKIGVSFNTFPVNLLRAKLCFFHYQLFFFPFCCESFLRSI